MLTINHGCRQPGGGEVKPKITKLGLVCSNRYMFKGGCTEKHLEPFTDKSALVNNDSAKFYYNYEPSVPVSVKSFLQEHKVEFVPMVGWRHFWLNLPGYKAHASCGHPSKQGR